MKNVKRRPEIAAGYMWGALTVETPTEQRKNKYIVWLCRCACGGEVRLDTRAIQRGTVTNCGCVEGVDPRIRDLRGQRFGHLTALHPTEQRTRSGNVIWRCRCELCGRELHLSNRQLISGNTKSCGGHPKTEVELGLLDDTSVRRLEYYLRNRFPSNKSGYVGVRRDTHSRKWIAEMRFQGRKILYEKHEHKADAIAARQRAEATVRDFLERFYAEHPEWDRNFYKEEK